MKSAKIFLAGMYLHLLLSIVIPIGILMIVSKNEDWTTVAVLLFVFYILMIVLVLIAGWISVIMAVIAYNRGQYEKLRNGWRVLKYASVPFYICNFCYSFVIWLILVGASRGLMILLVPIPVGITCTMIFQSGCIGWCYIKYLNKQREKSEKISEIHYLMQVIAVFDVISTMVISRKEKNSLQK